VTINQERKKRVIDLYYNQGKTTREIAKIERISIRNISSTLKEEDLKRQRHKDQQQQEEIFSKAYELFSEGKKPVEVAIILNLREPEATKLYREYWMLNRLYILNLVYKETNGKIWIVLKLYKELIKKRRMNIAQVVNVVEIAIHKLPYMESLYKQLKDEVDKLQYTIQGLQRYVDALERKISILDKTAFSCEQDCKRTEQQLQELIDKKDRIEKLITNIVNDEGYSKLKQTIKENVKAALSDNKTLLSISLTALIQTLKADAEMVNLIYNMLTGGNDREQPKDSNDNNIAKYLESNKDRILDLAEKNYQNLVKVLTNNAIDAAVPSPFNPILSLTSSCTFSRPPTQSDMHKEESESYHNGKGDIAD
jgi:hypothetical protein